MTTLNSTAERCRALPRLGALCLLALPLAAQAWNATGHRLVAEIAWQNLSPAARQQSARLLETHPDIDRWRERAKSDEPRAVFIEASTWPDEIRKDARFFTPDKDVPTPLLPGFPDMERHSSWHTAPRPIDGSNVPADFKPGQLDKQLVRQLAVLDSPTTQAPLRAYALPWVIHLLGDSHQPLHLSLRRAADGSWDRVGHAVAVNNPFNPRKNQMDLHEYWDSLPIAPSLRGERLASEARELLARHPRPAPGATPEQWIEESWREARDHAYPRETGTPVMISRDFQERSKTIAERRLVAAGHRLAERLNQAFAASPGTDTRP